MQIVLTRPMDLSAADAGTYAAVLINPNGEVFTFSFEDLLASQGSDWDFNDFRVQVTLA